MNQQSFRTEYQPLNSFIDDEIEINDEDQEVPPSNNVTQNQPAYGSAQQWIHIEDLDDFFTRIYQYHQRNGFWCMVVQDLLQLVQFVFVVFFATYLTSCVEYSVLFHHLSSNGSETLSIDNAVLPFDKCIRGMHPAVAFFDVMACLLWLFGFVKMMYSIFRYWEIKSFYQSALKIPQSELVNTTWHEVLRRTMEVQKELHMCIHKSELTELDIYHRILRFKNYMIAMVNKSLLPLKFNLPILGEYLFLTNGLKFNLEMILFWGPFSPFENNWHLKPEYRSVHKRKELIDKFSRYILFVGLANFVFSPIIFLWQIFYSFFRYAEMIKREPGTLGARRWSLYSRLFLRHFNELDHEFNSRLNQAYRPATKYVNIFISPMLVIIAKHVAFIVGSILAVIIILGCVDQDFFQVEHLFRTVTILSVILAVCQSLIPDEHMVSCPELLMRAILAQIHYIPDSWKGNAHTYKVRNEFTQLFQYKVTFLAEELLSPIVTPFVLCFTLRRKSADIIDFYRNFTVDVTGVGDVCSFAQMDIKKHGNPEWAPVVKNAESEGQVVQRQPAECGKTELSLVHFTLTNPEWRPPQTETQFIRTLKTLGLFELLMIFHFPRPVIDSSRELVNWMRIVEFVLQFIQKKSIQLYNEKVKKAHQDINNLSMLPADNPLLTSSHSMTQLGPRYNAFMMGTICRSSMPGMSVSGGSSGSVEPGGEEQNVSASQTHLRGSLRAMAGPQSAFSLAADGRQTIYDEGTLEYLSAEMSFSALYMHDIHRFRVARGQHEVISNEDERARAVWQTDNSLPLPPPSFSPMPNIQEEDDLGAVGGVETDYLLRLESGRGQLI